MHNERKNLFEDFYLLIRGKASPLFHIRRLLLWASLLSLLFFIFPRVSFAHTDLYAPPPKSTKKKRPCCSLGIAYRSGPGKVVLEQICQRSKTSVFHFRLKNLSSTCTHPEATILEDEKGRSYKMLRHTGLPACASGKLQTKANISFTWVFERLRPNTRRINLIEALDPVTQGMGHWYWRNVSLTHCKFK